MSASGTLIVHLTLVFWYFLLCQSGRCHLLSNLDQGSDIYHRDNHFGKTHIGDVGTLPKEEIKG